MAVPANKIKNFLNYLWGENGDTTGDPAEIDEEMNGYEEIDEDGYETGNSSGLGIFGSGRKAKVVNMPQQIKMKIAKPTNFDQVDEIICELKNKNAIVINLEYVNKDVARRIVDVVSGAIKALDGHIEKVSNSIFVIAPFNYDIVNEVTKEKIENKFASSLIR